MPRTSRIFPSRREMVLWMFCPAAHGDRGLGESGGFGVIFRALLRAYQHCVLFETSAFLRLSVGLSLISDRRLRRLLSTRVMDQTMKSMQNFTYVVSSRTYGTYVSTSLSLVSLARACDGGLMRLD